MMMHVFNLSAAPVPAFDDMLIEAARSWRKARDLGRPVQRSLSVDLARFECPILSPVLASLMRFFEAAIGRKMRTGSATDPSEDERLLVDLVTGDTVPPQIEKCTGSASIGLDCAIESTRVMIALAMSGHEEDVSQANCPAIAL